MEKLLAMFRQALTDSKANPHRGDLKILVMNLSSDLLREGYVGHLSGDCPKREGYLNRNGRFIEVKSVLAG
tara:strand:- start:17513 stop:17725 length:213 start_codon:yes stop_codon:yes gene_type:complete